MPIMDKKELIPGIIMLCGCCIRFLAYYRAGDRIQKKHKNKIQMQFWIYVSNSLLNMCILEWCKLFCEKDGKHFWKNGVEDEREFKNGLFKLEVMQGGEAEFDKYKKEIREYRDKYVAHRDLKEPKGEFKLDVVKETTIFLCEYLARHWYKEKVKVEEEYKVEYVELDEFMTGKKNLCDNAPEGGKKICDNKVVVVHELVEYEMWYEFITGG
ncbi:hypothetical protein AXF15_02005 [Desulfomicrobium orale DSM 12838]|uniref:HEPN AbiU2-like domain-containing protein n=2 Tax=Desulfomicrobium orale TaxID=132132 RepID=A0A0X8JNK0_9BACT|nr:hypothetical protein AXF15_02005 [Desulfomicrobium orale DSM 12838]